MTDENANTADLTTDEKLDRILAELVDVKTRLSALEAVAEDRTKETRPKLDLIIKEMSDLREEMRDVRKELRSIDRAFATFASDHTRMRADIGDFDERLTELERRPN